MLLKRSTHRSSLVVQWLGFGTFTAVARVQSLVRELRPRKPCSTAKKKEKRKKRGVHSLLPLYLPTYVPTYLL